MVDAVMTAIQLYTDTGSLTQVSIDMYVIPIKACMQPPLHSCRNQAVVLSIGVLLLCGLLKSYNCAVVLMSYYCAVVLMSCNCAVVLMSYNCAVVLKSYNCAVVLMSYNCAVVLMSYNCAVVLMSYYCAVVLMSYTVQSC